MKEKNELHISALTLHKNMFTMPAQSLLQEARIIQLEHLKGIKIPNVGTFDITILIGTNAPEVFIQSEVRNGLPNEPYAIKTALRWSLLGNITNKNESNNKNSTLPINRLDMTTRDEMLHQLVTQENLQSFKKT